MIIKMDTECIVNDWGSSIGYHENKVEQGVAELISSGSSMEGSADEKALDFDYTNSLNNKLRVKGFDIPFTFDKTDKVTDAMAIEICHDFMDRFGFEDRPFLLYKHEDTDNTHFHLVVSNTDWNGNINERLSGFYRKEATLFAREYEEKYDLKRLNEIGKGQQAKSQKEVNSEKYAYQKALIKAVNTGLFAPEKTVLNKLKSEKLDNNSIKILLGDSFSETITLLYKEGLLKETYKSQLIKLLDKELHKLGGDKDPKSFFNALEASGIYVHELKRTNPRVISYGIEMEDGKTMYFKSNQLPERFSYKSLLNSEKTNFTVDQQKKYIINMLRKAKQQSSNYDQFKGIVETKGISITELRNEEFGIYGLKFKSTTAKNPVDFSSSELAREFSYKKLQDYFENAMTKESDQLISSDNLSGDNLKPTSKGISPVKKVSIPKSGKVVPESKANEGAENEGVTKKAAIGEEEAKKGRKM